MRQNNPSISILKVFFFSFFLLISFSFQAQSSKIEVKKAAKKMFDDMNNRDYDAIIEMCHPKLFEFVPKEQMKAVFKTTFEGNEEYSVDIPKTVPEYTVSKIYSEETNNLEFAFVTYDLNMKMTFNRQTFDDNMKKMMISTMEAGGMSAKFLSDNVVDISMKDRITILLKDDTTKNKWVMINYEESPMMDVLLPENLLGTAKKYKEEMLKSKKKE